MKKIEITINHNLTPMHEESLEKMVQGVVKALEEFWQNKSKKEFHVNLDKPMHTGGYSPLQVTSSGATTFCGQCNKMKSEFFQNTTVAGDWCKCLGSLTSYTN